MTTTTAAPITAEEARAVRETLLKKLSAYRNGHQLSDSRLAFTVSQHARVLLAGLRALEERGPVQ